MEKNKLFVGENLPDVLVKVNRFLARPNVHYLQHSVWPVTKVRNQPARPYCYLLIYNDKSYNLQVGPYRLEFANHISKYLGTRIIQRLTSWLNTAANQKHAWKHRALARHPSLIQKPRHYRHF